MPVKTIVCAQCGAEVTKRQSRLVNGERICKSHEEAEAFAEQQRKADIKKALEARQWKKPSRSRRQDYGYSPFDESVSPIRRLAAFATLGKMHRDAMERDRLGKEMMALQFKAIGISVFLDTAVEGNDRDKLAEETKRNTFAKISASLAKMDLTSEGMGILKVIAHEAIEGQAEALTERLLSNTDRIPEVVKEIIDEYTDIIKREEEVRDQLQAYIQ